MDAAHDANAYQANHELAENDHAAPMIAAERGQRFILPWRLRANVGDLQWQQADDASCGSGPVD
jgi:hypothetical protein